MCALSTIDPFRADLHCHSTCSDGSLHPCELIDLAVSLGLSALSITDHDTIDAYDTANSYAKEKGILLGTGVEFSCQYKKKNIHVLGYDFSLLHPSLQACCKSQKLNRDQRNLEILEKLRRLRFYIEESDFAPYDHSTTIGRPHIAAVMVKKGYVKTTKEAFSFYLGDGKCCFVPGHPFPVEAAIEVIHQAKGKAFIAHPHIYNDATVIKEILPLGFDGIECHYSRCPPYKEKRWLKMAKERQLLQSGGSDFHGDAKPYVSLGCSWVDRATFFSIFDQNLA